MAGRRTPRERSREPQLQAISTVQRTCVLDVQHATWQVALRLGRGMDNHRAHGNDAACRHGAVNGGDLSRQLCDIGFRQQAKRVRPGKHAQRPVVWARIIQVQAQSHYLRQGGGGREGVGDASLDRPRTPFGHLTAFTKRKRCVLVPGDEPVPGGRLVEERRLVGPPGTVLQSQPCGDLWRRRIPPDDS